MNYPRRPKRSALRREPSRGIATETAGQLRELLDASRIDFDLLQRQRITLCQVLDRLAESDFSTRREDKDLTGILHLLDALQDAASDAGIWKYPGARCIASNLRQQGKDGS
jgi:hypothetical protein